MLFGLKPAVSSFVAAWAVVRRLSLWLGWCLRCLRQLPDRSLLKLRRLCRILLLSLSLGSCCCCCGCCSCSCIPQAWQGEPLPRQQLLQAGSLTSAASSSWFRRLLLDFWFAGLRLLLRLLSLLRRLSLAPCSCSSSFSSCSEYSSYLKTSFPENLSPGDIFLGTKKLLAIARHFFCSQISCQPPKEIYLCIPHV